jgi:hypothetical protein
MLGEAPHITIEYIQLRSADVFLSCTLNFET